MSDQKIAAGNYDMTCTGEVQYGTSNNGTEQVGIQLDVEGVLVMAILYFSPAAKPFSIAKLKACGWSGSGDIGTEIKGNTVKASVKYESYVVDGETKMGMKVNIFDGDGGITFKKPMSDSQKSNFLASLGASAPSNGAYPKDWDAAPPPASIPNGPVAKPGSFSLGNK